MPHFTPEHIEMTETKTAGYVPSLSGVWSGKELCMKREVARKKGFVFAERSVSTENTGICHSQTT